MVGPEFVWAAFSTGVGRCGLDDCARFVADFKTPVLLFPSPTKALCKVKSASKLCFDDASISLAYSSVSFLDEMHTDIPSYRNAEPWAPSCEPIM